MFKKVGAIVVLCFSSLMFGSLSHAGLIVDTMAIDQKVGFWQSYSYTHDINDDGFVLGSAESGTISIEIYDDIQCGRRGCGPDRQFEAAVFVIEDFDFDTGGISLSSFVGELEISALFALNTDGLLDVTVASLWGDFFIGDSVLSVVTNDDAVSVSEPGSIALLALGLAALVSVRRTH